MWSVKIVKIRDSPCFHCTFLQFIKKSQVLDFQKKYKFLWCQELWIWSLSCRGDQSRPFFRFYQVIHGFVAYLRNFLKISTDCLARKKKGEIFFIFKIQRWIQDALGEVLVGLLFNLAKIKFSVIPLVAHQCVQSVHKVPSICNVYTSVASWPSTSTNSSCGPIILAM